MKTGMVPLPLSITKIPTRRPSPSKSLGREAGHIENKRLIPAAAVAALAVLLLAGFQQGNHEKDKAPPVEQTQATVDTTEEDTMAAYYERMQRMRMLLEGSHWESEK
jgi:hypothetical protein